MQNTMLDNIISTNSQELSNASASSAIKLFENPLFKARVIMRRSEPWFVAKDVATCIEHSNVTKMCELCRDKDKVVESASNFDSNDLLESGNARITLISESGLYRILAKCNLPKCEPFENWVFDEVLPSIRKTGSYSVAQTTLAIPKTLPEALRAYADEVERREAAEKRAITAESERDEAIRTKAQIGSTREATAMATASSARAHQRFAEKVLEINAGELITLRAVAEERRSQLWDANRTAHAIYRLNVLKKEYSLNTLENKARRLLSHFALKLNKDPIPFPNGSTYTDSFGRLQPSMSTYYERDVADAALNWVSENTNDFARLGGKRDPLHDEW